MRFFDHADDKSIVLLMGAQYLLSGTKAFVEALAPILTAAQIVVAIVTAVWIWRRAQGQRLENRRLHGRLKRKR